MFWSNLLQALTAGHNPIGFGPADALELALAAFVLVAALFGRPWIEPFVRQFAAKTRWCMLLLAADTLRHFRLANPPHALPRFFETFFVLQEPTYSSIYPLGPALALAIGWTIFGLHGPASSRVS